MRPRLLISIALLALSVPATVSAKDQPGQILTWPEFGTSAHDTIELRDGTILSGDLLSVDATEVTIRVGGTPQHFDRNQVKRILLVERTRS